MHDRVAQYWQLCITNNTPCKLVFHFCLDVHNDNYIFHYREGNTYWSPSKYTLPFTSMANWGLSAPLRSMALLVHVMSVIPTTTFPQVQFSFYVTLNFDIAVACHHTDKTLPASNARQQFGCLWWAIVRGPKMRESLKHLPYLLYLFLQIRLYIQASRL